LFNANSAIVQPSHGENTLIFNEMMMRSDFIVLAHADRHVAPLGTHYPDCEPKPNIVCAFSLILRA